MQLRKVNSSKKDSGIKIQRIKKWWTCPYLVGFQIRSETLFMIIGNKKCVTDSDHTPQFIPLCRAINLALLAVFRFVYICSWMGYSHISTTPQNPFVGSLSQNIEKLSLWTEIIIWKAWHLLKIWDLISYANNYLLNRCSRCYYCCRQAVDADVSYSDWIPELVIKWM